MTGPKTDGAEDADNDLGLPNMGDTNDVELEGVAGDAPIELTIRDDGGDPFDDSYADDVPIDDEIQTDHVEPTALGDASVGIDGGTEDDGVRIEEGGESMIDEGRGHAEEGLDFGGDDELGIDPIPTEVDDGGAEGLVDPVGENIEEHDFPPLDGDDDDDDAEELDLGLELDAPPPSEETEDSALED